eukprot:gene11101-19964_t
MTAFISSKKSVAITKGHNERLFHAKERDGGLAIPSLRHSVPIMRSNRLGELIHRWISDGSSLMSGVEFIGCVQLHAGVLPTTKRASRGRPARSVYCDACGRIETVGHILQSMTELGLSQNDLKLVSVKTVTDGMKTYIAHRRGTHRRPAYKAHRLW